mmetsp:Transcript_20427/g.53161  ORF Transcript_20427/g.53161 Transcript_20427/m.53161 type:complete len:437 (-) Transcript_20427:16-1326(-)
MAAAAMWSAMGVGVISAMADAREFAGLRVAFGSCSRITLPQALWPDILSRQPDLWIWGGDNVYLDYKYAPFKHAMPSPERIEEMYARQLAHPGYRELLAAVPVIGTWDDHDYGINDGGWSLPIKNVTRTAFLDFIETGQNASLIDPARRTREYGVYTSHIIADVNTGPSGKPVGVILLDLRWNQYRPGDPAPLLGSAQWAWFEATLRRFNDTGVGLTVIVTSLTALAEPRAPFESWEKFPTEKRRLMELVATAGHPTVLLSGDVHLGEVNMASCHLHDSSAPPFTVLEITSSGMTHTHGDWWFDRFVQTTLHYMVPHAYRRGMTLEHNYGNLDVDWATGTLVATVYGEGNTVLLRHTARLADLVGNVPVANRTQVTCVPAGSNPTVSTVQLKLSLTAFVAFIASIVIGAVVLVVGMARRALAAISRLIAGRQKKTK